jgi:hypothetical protein
MGLASCAGPLRIVALTLRISQTVYEPEYRVDDVCASTWLFLHGLFELAVLFVVGWVWAYDVLTQRTVRRACGI